ncbi:hypothetical protein [Mycobacteroides abscessus]|uniref:hypothetical protein n=1 Tax=Mycobacteroides abscessus TaxID=36809 RepID=UPI00092B6111|nr:hypothetical protein [Mycobacteroides abscessus]SHQ39921.1 Uncharacterised protein [Mycobacteroides abscessus subsp. abscessus]
MHSESDLGTGRRCTAPRIGFVAACTAVLLAGSAAVGHGDHASSLLASPMQTGSTVTPSPAPTVLPTPKAAPAITGPAPLPREQESARD